LITHFFTYLNALFSLLGELWLFFLLGFITAGAVSVLVPSETLLRLFGKNNLATLARATVAGLFASICSCGAIPISVTLRNKGATQAAALTFLLAAPWAGLLQLIIFYRFLGFFQTAIVFVGALTVAFTTGIALAYMENKGWLSPNQIDNPGEIPEIKDPVLNPQSLIQGQGLSEGQIGVSVVPTLKRQTGMSVILRQTKQKIRKIGMESWEAFQELWKFLTIGLLLAAVLSAFVPEEWIRRFLGGEASFNPLLTALPVAAGVELCSEGFSIFAGQLSRMGAILPVIFVVVLVGVSTDFTELTVIWGKFGRKTALLYLLTATILTLIVGHLIWFIF
jgi:uncharacterized membrane protein YraQ (UPF0718 family)